MIYKVTNPYTGRVEAIFPEATPVEIVDAYRNAQKYYNFAQQQQVAERVEKLHLLAQVFRDNATNLARLATVNMGKLYTEALGEVNAAANIAEYYAENGAQALQDKNYTYKGNQNAILHYEATGIVLAIEPWNFPYTQVMRVFAPNYLLGNAVILKHAPSVAGCARELEMIVKQATIKKGAFKNLFLNEDQVGELIKQPLVQGVALTGSVTAGRIVAGKTSANLVKTTLELGGNDAFIVLPDADLKKAAADAVTARLRNAGQACNGAKRYIVTKEQAAEFIELVKKGFENQILGDPLEKQTTLAPLATREQQLRLQKQVEMAVAHGAKILLDGGIEKRAGFFFKPILITDLTPDNPMFDEEFFGPVGQVHIVEDIEAAIRLANQSQYGLAGSIYTNDTSQAITIAKQLETGQVFINQPAGGYPELPFGGVKNSGYGREMSELALYEFANQKIIAL